MSERKGISRRTVIKGALAGAATGIAGFPFISYGQSDVIRTTTSAFAARAAR